MNIIDFHTHVFEDFIAQKAIEKLSKSANIISYSDGTEVDLKNKNEQQKIGLSISLPVATRMMQSDNINARNNKKNLLSDDTGIIHFAAIHPDDSNVRIKLSNFKKAGFKGIKLHPVFQSARIDEKCYLEILDAASELGLITVLHAGEDISFPGNDNASVKYILNMLKQVKPMNLVLAHMGGWNEWDIVESDLAGAEVYLDTSFCLGKVTPADNDKPSSSVTLSNEQFLRILKKHGSDKILFGSDSPWTEREEDIRQIKETGLGERDLEKIFSLNAKKLLNMD